MARCSLILVVALAFFLLTGCSESPLLEGAVKTTAFVTLDGQPVDGAAVTFSPIGGGRSATGLTNAQGYAEMGTNMPGDGVFPGNYKITVVKSMTDPSVKVDESNEAQTGRYQSAPMIYLVPKKYIIPQTSGLTATVQDGVESTIPLKLDSK